MRKIIVAFLSVICLGIVLELMLFPPADKRTRTKVRLIRNELSKNGLHPSWIIISETRYGWYNSILSNSSKNSYHLQGKAIDLFVFDINNDGKFDSSDINLIRVANKEVEREHPGLVGAVGTYTTKGYPTNKMVHIDTRGYEKYYNY